MLYLNITYKRFNILLEEGGKSFSHTYHGIHCDFFQYKCIFFAVVIAAIDGICRIVIDHQLYELICMVVGFFFCNFFFCSIAAGYMNLYVKVCEWLRLSFPLKLGWFQSDHDKRNLIL